MISENAAAFKLQWIEKLNTEDEYDYYMDMLNV